MSMTFSDLQSEVARRATRDQSGSQFTTAIKNAINTSLFRIAREANWKSLRRTNTFTTVASRTTGTITATNGSSTFSGASLSWITNGIHVGRRLTIEGSTQVYTVQTITGENSFTTDYTYDGTSDSGLTYTLYGQELYNLPIQTNKEAIIWHEKFGFPFKVNYVGTNEKVNSGASSITSATPTHYTMWDEDWVLRQPIDSSVMTVVSSSSSDSSQTVTIYGTVSGYPDKESILLTGTSSAAGSKTFSSIERIVKSASTVGRVTVTSNSGNVTVAVIPAGAQSLGAPYKKVKLYPLPDAAFPINVYYYKEPYALVDSTDMHELGQEFDEAIILHATSKIKFEQNIEQGDKVFGLYTDEINSLKKYNVDKLDWLPTLLRPENSRNYTARVSRYLSYSQLGGYYGPGGY